MESETRPTIKTFEDQVRRELALSIRTMQPAKVLAYNDATSTAKIELAHQRVERDRDDTEDIVSDPVVVDTAPVLQLGGSTHYVRMPVTVGTTGVALVSDRAMGAWRVDGKAHPPPLAHTHNLGDVIFIPGLRPDSAPLPPAALGGLILQSTAIQLGTAAVLGAARVTDPVAASAAMVAYATAISAAFTALGAIPANAPAAAACAAVAPLQAAAMAQIGAILSGSTKTFIE